MASRRRRSRPWWKSLRRTLIDHRFNAAEAALGLAAIALGLWLMWPAMPTSEVDHRDLWQRSLSEAEQRVKVEAVGPEGGGLVAVARASISVSAKDEVAGLFGAPGAALKRPRLARVAAVMPEIGPPAPSVVPDEVALLPERLRRPAPDLDTLDSRPPHDQALLTPSRRLPGDIYVPTWLRNAALPPNFGSRPMIAVVIDDLGLNRSNTAALNRLPGPLTLAFLPYAGALESQADAARAAGHELMVHMPMEPEGDDWPGPDALLEALDRAEFLRRLNDNFAQFTGYVGLNNHMGSRLTSDPELMALVMQEARRRDLLFLDSKTTSRSVALREARRHGVPSVERDVFLDNDIELPAIRRQLAILESVARRRGVAVAIGHPHDMTIEALRHWLPQLEGKGLRLVPLSTVVARTSCSPALRVAGCTTAQAQEPGEAAQLATAPGDPPG